MALKKPYGTFLLLAFLFFLFGSVQYSCAQSPADWENEMQEFEKLDRQHSYPEDAIFFTGSSSIRLWRTIEEDMAPYSVISRGFGGSKMPDLLHYSDRYIKHHKYQAMVLFVANDIVGNAETDLSPQLVQELFEEFIIKIKGYNPEAILFIVEVTPTNARWAAWPQIHTANTLIAQLADEYENVMFIPTQDLFLLPDGTPDDHLFVSDRLHMNEKGYELWTKRIRSYLDPVLQD